MFLAAAVPPVILALVGWIVAQLIHLASEMNLNGYPLGFSDGLVASAIILAFATFSYSITRAQVAKLETQNVLADLREQSERLVSMARGVMVVRHGHKLVLGSDFTRDPARLQDAFDRIIASFAAESIPGSTPNP